MPDLFRRLASWPLAARIVLLLALAIGLAERIGWAMARRTMWATGEATNVAMALAHGRGFSDAFWAGQGPTAHLLPIAPAIAGLVYRLFGDLTPLSETILCAWSIGLTFGNYALVYAIARRLGTPRSAALGALCVLLVAPIYTTNEAFEWRVWEGGLGLLCANLLLWMVVRAETGAPPRRLGLWLALLPALTFFINPPLGLCAYAGWALYLWRNRRTPAAIAKAAAATVLVLALMIGPWTLRNWRAMGAFIPLRDNLGMELAVANHPAAVTSTDRDKTFLARLTAIQPYIHPPAQRALVAAGGEVAYAKLLGAQTRAWIAAHPGDFLTLCRRHLGQMVFPGTWMFMTSHGKNLPIVRSILARAVAVLGLLGLIVALARRHWRFLYVLPFVAVPILVYVPFQPVIRYCWLVYPIEAMLAASLIGRLARARPQSSSSS
ncbi:hypothetical protein HZF05_07895 [Sphingomonas sp. CGMCC 1.13654]|uniref:Glycosyltransferase RgtA/B/C/D-like domain-containing protein n=1 Tax=Sphingomonas chungangi TaxID=2683589 RepID=A0A838L547_9SPHN|nr:hypothetical protein [Sphingomonas chungangi]MBA2934020.1 hypothetical protein [Sphingomonas chungangi]MVW57766.1 hypothetical protein [Sphingomonas chungangi]